MVSLDTTFATKINIVEPRSFFLIHHFTQVSKHVQVSLHIISNSYWCLCAMELSIFTMHIAYLGVAEGPTNEIFGIAYFMRILAYFVLFSYAYED